MRDTSPASPTASMWHGVRMRHVELGVDPDAAPRRVTVPLAWDDAAAAALVALAPGATATGIALAAAGWLERLAADSALARRMQSHLLRQRLAPGAATWRGAADLAPGMVINLAAFAESGAGFDAPALLKAADDAFSAWRVLSPAAARLCCGVAGLAGMLAAAGIDYDSAPARLCARTVMAALQSRLRQRAQANGRTATVVVTQPGPVEALLGVEVGGVAPAFSPLDAQGRLARWARGALAIRGMAPEAALASLLAGGQPLPVAGHAAHVAMRDAVAPFVDVLPALVAPIAPASALASVLAPRELPSRRNSTVRKASVGGHRVFLRTGEYADGALGEIEITLPKESPSVRALAECLAQALSIGLQHGVPLAAYVEALAGSHFGPAGAVEGDASVARASSPVDYVMRSLAAAYLPAAILPAPALDEAPASAPPLLPLELPQEPRRALLRVVR